MSELQSKNLIETYPTIVRLFSPIARDKNLDLIEYFRLHLPALYEDLNLNWRDRTKKYFRRNKWK